MIFFNKKTRCLLFLVTGIILCAAGIYGLVRSVPVSFCEQTEEGPSLEQQLDALPDHDYVRDIRSLMEQEKYGEAKVLCEDVVRLDLPGVDDAKKCEEICDRELSSMGRRIMHMTRAFVTGDPGNSVEEAGAAFAADMMMYGDIRDLVKQGYFKCTGQETDVFIAAAAAAGLLTEFIDAVDWMPALMKALYRTKALTQKMCSVIIASVKNSQKAGKILPDTKKMFGNFAKLYKKTGFLRTRDIVRTSENAAELEKVTALAEKTPELTHLLSRTAKSDTVKVIDKLDTLKQPGLLRKIITKGPAGTTLALRFVKSVRKKNVQILSERVWDQLLQTKYGRLIPAGMLIAGICSVLCSISGFKRSCSR